MLPSGADTRETTDERKRKQHPLQGYSDSQASLGSGGALTLPPPLAPITSDEAEQAALTARVSADVDADGCDLTLDEARDLLDALIPALGTLISAAVKAVSAASSTPAAAAGLALLPPTAGRWKR